MIGDRRYEDIHMRSSLSLFLFFALFSILTLLVYYTTDRERGERQFRLSLSEFFFFFLLSFLLLEFF